MKNTLVTIKTNPDPNIKINFNCWPDSCIYDADGKPNSIAPQSFPFPGLRVGSLVLRVGGVNGQVVQGGTNMSFRTDRASLLELCINDYKLDDNTGAWGIAIYVDESNAIQ